MGERSWRAAPAPPTPRGSAPPSGGLWAAVDDLRRPDSPNAVEALQASSYLLWVLSGRRWGGVRTATEVYTCADECDQGCVWQDLQLPTGRTISWCADHDGAWCGAERLLFLRNRPVIALLGMRDRDGAALDLGQYAVWDRAFVGPRVLGRCSSGCWDPCGVEVDYQWGAAPPMLGRLAAAELANEFVNAVECPEECRLPERVTSVSRQGLSFQVFDPQDFMNDGRTGIYAVDVFLKSVNPDKAQKRARVWSVDMPQGRTRTWPRSTARPSGGRYG